MKAATAMHSIRQLCSLGLGGQVIMPALLEAVQRLVPSHFSRFFWTDTQGEVTNTYCNNSTSHAFVSLYFHEFYNKAEVDVWPGFCALTRKTQGAVDVASLFYTKEVNTDLYNVILRPQGIRHILAAVVRQYNQCVGTIMLYRRSQDPAYSQPDAAKLTRILPYIEHGLHAHESEPATFADSNRSGLLVLDPSGRIKYADTGGRHLLFLVNHEKLDPASKWQTKPLTIPAPLQRICKDLCLLSQGYDVPPPVFHHRNAWGQFSFRAYWLESGDHPSHSFIGVTIRRQEPQSLILWHNLSNTTLSARQRELCLLLQENQSTQSIAERMRISRHTVTDYIQEIYNKLGVNTREEMLKRLGM